MEDKYFKANKGWVIDIQMVILFVKYSFWTAPKRYWRFVNICIHGIEYNLIGMSLSGHYFRFSQALVIPKRPGPIAAGVCHVLSAPHGVPWVSARNTLHSTTSQHSQDINVFHSTLCVTSFACRIWLFWRPAQIPVKMHSFKMDIWLVLLQYEAFSLHVWLTWWGGAPSTETVLRLMEPDKCTGLILYRAFSHTMQGVVI